MNIIFIHHSCFLVEVDEKVILFDWFAGDRVEGYHFTGEIPQYEPDTPIYIFASHKHRDHFDMDVLRWAKHYTNIHYIFSGDCKMSNHFLVKHGIDPEIKNKILYARINETYQTDDLKIETFLSSDAGVAYYVQTNGVNLYHAGDMYNWKWEGAGDLINGRMEATYKAHVKKLSQKKIHLAFVPLDPRLDRYQMTGMEYFISHTNADYIFPMHMWQDYSGIAELRESLSPKDAARIVEITHENQVFPIQER